MNSVAEGAPAAGGCAGPAPEAPAAAGRTGECGEAGEAGVRGEAETAAPPDGGVAGVADETTVPEQAPTDDLPTTPVGPPPAAGGSCGQCTGYLDSLARLKAEFANYRRRATEQQAQAAGRGAADLAARLLPVLDASEAGAAHDATSVGPLHSALLDALTGSGLEVISPVGEPFDPNFHEAVMHTAATETGEGAGEVVVTDVLRTGYSWDGRVLRPAVVGVRG